MLVYEVKHKGPVTGITWTQADRPVLYSPVPLDTRSYCYQFAYPDTGVVDLDWSENGPDYLLGDMLGCEVLRIIDSRDNTFNVVSPTHAVFLEQIQAVGYTADGQLCVRLHGFVSFNTPLLTAVYPSKVTPGKLRHNGMRGSIRHVQHQEGRPTDVMRRLTHRAKFTANNANDACGKLGQDGCFYVITGWYSGLSEASLIKISQHSAWLIDFSLPLSYSIHDFDVSPDGKRLALALTHNTLVEKPFLRIYSIEDSSCLEIQSYEWPATRVAYSPDGSMLAMAVCKAVEGSLLATQVDGVYIVDTE